VVQLSLPFFARLTEVPLPSLFSGNYGLGALFGVVFLLGTLLSGIYPALLLASFNPVSVLKGKLSSSVKGARLRKVLVVGQFAISLALTIGTALVYSQLSFMQKKALGIDISQVLVVQAPRVIPTDSLYTRGFEAFKNTLKGYQAVKSFTASTAVPGKATNWGDMIRKKEAQEDKAIGASVIGVDYDFMNAYRAKFVAGRNFSVGFKTDNQAVLLNRKACQMIGFDKPEDAIGKQVVRIGETFQVIGVIEDYHQKSLKEQVEPIIYHLRPQANNYYSLKIDAKDLSNSIAQVKLQYEQAFPHNPFQYFFLDESFNALYHAEIRLGQIIGLFSGLAVFVASLGLFGLASFATTQRTKEIGVRKVLGASTAKIVFLLNKDFVKLVVLANFIAWPLAYIGISKWLENYAFPVEINLWLFVVPALLMMLIAILTISSQTIKAARANPIKALKYE
jgi:putative ABC transport system permease protein